MSAGAISGASAGAGAAVNRFGDLSSEDFIKVMISELSKQDPMNPQDSSKLLEQFSSLRNIESQLSLQQQLQTLVLQNQVSSAGGLIGKMVAGLDESNTNVVGTVSSVIVQNGKAYLELDSGKILSMDRVVQIADAATVTGS
jgi:flagellar basal-body rod modification protein FlgD